MLHAPLTRMAPDSESASDEKPTHPQDEDGGRSDVFRRLAHSASEKLGSHWAFLAAVTIVAVWAVSGPVFGFSQGWQLVINTGTTIITFLMVFLIQATQNRDATAVHLKLDELIRASEARNVFADLEDANEAELTAFKKEFEQLRNAGKQTMAAATEARDRTLDRTGDSSRTKNRRG